MRGERRAYLEPAPDGGLYWGPLAKGTLVRRYKRFLADVVLDDGAAIVAHTANTGTMLGCSEPGRTVWLSRHEGRGRKHPFTLEMIDMPTALVGVNTGVPNRLVKNAVLCGKIPELADYDAARSEVGFGSSRLDLMLSSPERGKAYVEIKNCSLAEDGVAYFPDAVTARGTKHLGELEIAVSRGERAVLFLLVQRGDATAFSPADHIDPEWGRALRRAISNSVEILAYRARLGLDMTHVGPRLPVRL
ncbi:MAG: DNA/RNA nuclease SfsA [Planctomycetota bacterium]|jgi:sugar fermentation stimulation protein A|nr:DNA/RNA nuclease SfsA [Planctomycetota bacterium]